MCFTALFTAEFALRLYACDSVAERLGPPRVENGGRTTNGPFGEWEIDEMIEMYKQQYDT
jgi:hypothetical protein